MPAPKHEENDSIQTYTNKEKSFNLKKH